MAILSGWIKTRAYRKTADGYKKESRDTSSETVYMNDGNTVETNLGDIRGQITEVDERLALLEYMTLQNDFTAPLTVEAGNTLLVDDIGFAIVADWKI